MSDLEQQETTETVEQSDEAEAQQQTESEGTEPETGEGEPDLASEVEKWKALARKHETRSKENAKAAQRLQEIEDSQKSELEKVQERAEVAEARALASARRIAATEAGLPAEMADRLKGSSDEELVADAKVLAESLGAVGKPKVQDFDTKAGPRGSGQALTVDAQIAEAHAKGDTATAIRLANSKLFDMVESR